VPLSHPFVERLIGTIRREYLDRILFWTTADLEEKLIDFQHYYNGPNACGAGRAPAGTACGEERYHQLVSVLIGGGGTAEACTKLR
jgi:hypothetical protein